MECFSDAADTASEQLFLQVSIRFSITDNMRIAIHIDCPFWEPTGIARYMFELANALKKRGNHLDGWARWRWARAASSAFMKMDIPVHTILSTKNINDPFFPLIHASRGNIDVIHSPNGQLLPFSGKIPQTVMVHDLAVFLYPDLKSAKETANWKRKVAESVANAKAIMVNSVTTAEDLKEFFPESENKIFLTRLGIDHFKRQEFRNTANGKHILAVGTVDPRKNYENLFKAYIAAASEQPDLPPLIVAGVMGYRSEEIRSIAENSPCRNRIRFEGYVTESRLKELYETACCLVHTAIYEGFGFTIPEALGFGLPVVCADNSSLKELFSEAVYLVDADDPESIAHGLIQALENGVLENQKHEVNRLFETLTWDNCAKYTEAAFKQII